MSSESIVNKTIRNRWESYAPSSAKTRVLGWINFAYTTRAAPGSLENALALRNHLLGALWCAELALTSPGITDSMRQLLEATRRDLDARLYGLADELERAAERQGHAGV